MDHGEVELGEPLVNFLCIGLSLLYLGKHVICVNYSIPLWWHAFMLLFGKVLLLKKLITKTCCDHCMIVKLHDFLDIGT
jgi:hypothetical protein